MLIVKQGGIKYYFWVFFMSRTGIEPRSLETIGVQDVKNRYNFLNQSCDKFSFELSQILTWVATIQNLMFNVKSYFLLQLMEFFTLKEKKINVEFC